MTLLCPRLKHPGASPDATIWLLTLTALCTDLDGTMQKLTRKTCISSIVMKGMMY